TGSNSSNRSKSSNRSNSCNGSNSYNSSKNRNGCTSCTSSKNSIGLSYQQENTMKLTKKNSFMLGAWKLALVLAMALVLSGNSALAASAAEIDQDVTAALQTLRQHVGSKRFGGQGKRDSGLPEYRQRRISRRRA